MVFVDFIKKISLLNFKRTSSATLRETLIDRENELIKIFNKINKTEKNKEEVIWEFIISNSIKRKNKIDKENIEQIKNEFLEFSQKKISKCKPINFFFLDLPIKTSKEKIFPDGAEIWMFHNLDAINKIIQKIYPPGIQFNILCDGSLYLPKNVLSELEVETYQKNLKNLLKELNINSINIWDWRNAFEIMGTNFKNEYKKTKENFTLKTNAIDHAIFNRINKRVHQLDSMPSQEKMIECYKEKMIIEEIRNKLNIPKHNDKFGFYITQSAHINKRKKICIYTIDTHIEQSPSRGFALFNKNSKTKKKRSLISEKEKNFLLDEKKIKPIFNENTKRTKTGLPFV
jgi:hypothetical protein